ncbi:hypothetical protein TWF718_001412 [Orbilia javanica]|uniref:Uncharacterized protein n=1 Tax=Orbilia javanica TaxID=47235 RepID=A0AAN8N5D8_9PEZI
MPAAFNFAPKDTPRTAQRTAHSDPGSHPDAGTVTVTEPSGLSPPTRRHPELQLLSKPGTKGATWNMVEFFP